MSLEEVLRKVERTGNAGVAFSNDDLLLLVDPYMNAPNVDSLVDFVSSHKNDTQGEPKRRIALFTHGHYDHGFRLDELNHLFEEDFEVIAPRAIQEAYAEGSGSYAKDMRYLLSRLDTDGAVTWIDGEDSLLERGVLSITPRQSEHPSLNPFSYLKNVSRMNERVKCLREHLRHPEGDTYSYELELEGHRVLVAAGRCAPGHGAECVLQSLPRKKDVEQVPTLKGVHGTERLIPLHDDDVDALIGANHDYGELDVEHKEPLYKRRTPMPEEICTINWRYLIDYIENTPDMPSGLAGRDALREFMRDLVNTEEHLVRNPRDQRRIQRLRDVHLRSDAYWHSNELSLKIFENAERVIGGFRPLYQAGIIAGYQMINDGQPARRLQLARLISPRLVLQRVSRINSKYNKTKTPRTTFYKGGDSTVELGYHEEFKERTTKHVCDWNMGIYTGMGKFIGTYDTRVEEQSCVAEGDDDCVFNVRWTHFSFLRKLGIFLHSVVDPDYIINSDYDNLRKNDLTIRQAGIIENKTRELQEAHEREQNLEQQLRIQEVMQTGDDISAQILHDFKTLLQPIGNYVYRNKRLVDASHRMLEQMDDESLQEIGLERGRMEKMLGSIRKSGELAENSYREILSSYEDFRQAYNPREEGLYDVNRDLEAAINLVIDRNYRTFITVERDFSDVSVPESYTPSQLNKGVFMNLIKNAREAILERAEGSDYEGRMKVKSETLDEKTCVSVYDNGVQVPDKEEIFNKKYTTKPGGTGLGLFNARFIIEEGGMGRVYCTDSELEAYTKKFVVELDL